MLGFFQLLIFRLQLIAIKFQLMFSFHMRSHSGLKALKSFLQLDVLFLFDHRLLVIDYSFGFRQNLRQDPQHLLDNFHKLIIAVIVDQFLLKLGELWLGLEPRPDKVDTHFKNCFQLLFKRVQYILVHRALSVAHYSCKLFFLISTIWPSGQSLQADISTLVYQIHESESKQWFLG